jgi:hypothetical protein
MPMKILKKAPLLFLLLITACGPGDRLVLIMGVAPENKNCVLDTHLKSSGHRRAEVSGDFEEAYSTRLWYGERFSSIKISCEGKEIYKKEDLPFSNVYIGNLDKVVSRNQKSY